MRRHTLPGPANRLLASLPPHSRRRLLAQCDVVTLEPGQILDKPGQRTEHAYFPTAGVVSQLMRLDDGAQFEFGIVGDEGMLGIALILGTPESLYAAVVQSMGSAVRIEAASFRRLLAVDEPLRRLSQRYVYVLMAQVAQAAVCARRHTVEARLARWLLLTRDRAHATSFPLTHESLADMLDVRRAGITHAAVSLRNRGLIRYRRGEIKVLDGPGLESASCACYGQGNAIYRRVFGA